MSVNQTELAREVQRKTEAATASLKRGPSAKYHDANISSISLARKRITPHQISTPHLVSASTSMDTIPLHSPSVTSSNALPQKSAKFGQRIRRWGTLRSKPTMPTGEEITPFPLDAQPQSPLAQSAGVTSDVNIPQAPASASLAEFGKPKDPLPSPPATAGPGLKGFMSRFRKPRTADMSPERDRRSIEQDRRSRPPISNPLSATSTSPLNEFVFPRQDLPNQSRSTPAGKLAFQNPASDIIHLEPRTSAPLAEWGGPSKPTDPPRQAGRSETNVNDTLALKQLFDAASNLGLDQTALNDLLARSGSTSSRSTAGWTMLTRNNSAATSSRPTTQNESTMGRARSPMMSEDGPTMDGFLERNDDTVISNVVPRKREQPSRARIEGENGEAETNAVVRRTIIIPSESRTSTIDLNILMRKNSSVRRHRSASAGSITSSSRSVHDRAPTPPPPRSSAARRFSHDASPPVPQLPVSLSSQAESLFPLATPRPTAAGPPMEKSSSAYDSL
jgi:serine/arginine repetitive matrix protein 2